MGIMFRAVGRDFEREPDAQAHAQAEMTALGVDSCKVFLIGPGCMPVELYTLHRRPVVLILTD